MSSFTPTTVPFQPVLILQQQTATIYEKAPRTTSKAYTAAQKALKFNEELTFSDEEIDLLLPKTLQKKEQVGLVKEHLEEVNMIALINHLSSDCIKTLSFI